MQIDEWMEIAYGEAAAGAAEGGVPIGAALIRDDGFVLAQGRNGSVQHGDFLEHAETAAVRAAGKQKDYSETALVTTMTPCWYCAGMVRFLGIGTVVVGDATTWSDESLHWLSAAGVTVHVMDHEPSLDLFRTWHIGHQHLWDLPVSTDGWQRP